MDGRTNVYIAKVGSKRATLNPVGMRGASIEKLFLNQKQIEHQLEQLGRGHLLITSKVPSKQTSNFRSKIFTT